MVSMGAMVVTAATVVALTTTMPGMVVTEATAATEAMGVMVNTVASETFMAERWKLLTAGCVDVMINQTKGRMAAGYHIFRF